VPSGRSRKPHAVLTRHFLRTFLENDLISPDSDRAQLMAVVGGGIVTLTLFMALFSSFRYVGIPMTPGEAALSAFNDRFSYLALSMIITALVAASQWDSLTVDARDTAILEPLPLRATTIRRAKMAAVGILGAAVAIGVNAAPTVIFPWLLVYHMPVTVADMVTLNLAHGLFSIGAAACAYLAVLALRETLAGLLGPRWFAQVSPWTQGALIVVLGSALLLLPPAGTRIQQGGLDGWRAMTPPMWFAGAYEMAAGGIIAEAPRGRMTPRQQRTDAATTATYRAHRGDFEMLARRSAMAFGSLSLLIGGMYLLNSQRLPPLAVSASGARRRRWRITGWIARTLIVRNPTARAGFYFTLAAMWRSNTHRLTIACAAAAGVAMSLIALSGVDLEAARSGRVPVRLIVMQPLLYGALLIAFRHAVRVPAELRANWGFQLAWQERDRAFLAGARRAAIAGLVVPALLLCVPLFAYVLGPLQATAHAVMGLAGAIVFLEALMAGYDKVPFTCTYLPDGRIKAVGIPFIVAFVMGASSFARMELEALQGGGAIRLFVTLAVLFAILRVVSLKRARLPNVEFDEAPASFQRLGLHT
jgi:hypothetical protein